jgi:hypothetical protein
LSARLDPPPPPVELTPPDIARYRIGSTAIPYATTLESGKPGPHAMIMALVHGNEICGAIALDFLFREKVKPTRGRLSLCFANVAAYQRFNPAEPEASRFVSEDFNRLWDRATLEGPRRSVELERARELRPLIDKVDLLLDIHSMQQNTAPLALAGTTAKGIDLARRIGAPELIVVDPGHAAGPRLRDYGPFGDPADKRAAVLVECGQHWLRPTADTAIQVALHFLRSLDMIDPGVLKAHLRDPAPPPQRVIEVTHVITVAGDRFDYMDDYQGLEVIQTAGTVIGHDGASPVATPYNDCVLIMPSRRLTRGQTAVRLGRFV